MRETVPKDLVRFPFLFQRDDNKKGMVAEKYSYRDRRFVCFNDGGLALSSQNLIHEASDLDSLLGGYSLNDRRDKWQWNGGKVSAFSVKEAKKFLNGERDYSNRQVFKWSKWIPRKCNIFMWSLGMNRIPTLDALAGRKCSFGSLNCGLCEKEEESVEHLFFSCEVASEVWYQICSWCKVQPFFFFSVADVFEVHNVPGLSKTKRQILKGIVFITCWILWKNRNEKKFDNGTINIDRIVLDIKSISFFWHRNRSKGIVASLEEWQNFDML